MFNLMAVKCVRGLAALALLALAVPFASASDPSQLQDFCVAIDDPLNGVFVNGKFCKNPANVSADDFFFHGLNKPGVLDDLGVNETHVDVDEIKGLNTLGISFARIDFGPYGENPPHTHPRASEILVVLEGILYVGFVASDQNDNRFFPKTLYPGDVFVFPQGMIHFQFNPGHSNAVAFSAFGSQNPGDITIAKSVFGSDPPIKPDVLAKAFQLDVNVVKDLQTKFREGDGK